MMRVVLAGLIAVPSLASAQMAQTFALPAGCTAYLTVQQTDCSVSHHFTCEADPEGVQRRVDLDEEGVTYFGAIDAETQWIESYFPRSGHSEFLMPDPERPASLTELIETGINTYDFSTTSPEIGTTRYVGEDRLTGETVTIDGVTLERTEYAITAFDAFDNEVWSSSGREFISRDWRMFIGGESRNVTPDEEWETDSTPVEFLFPDDAGFLSARPKHGCGVMMSALPQSPIPPATQVEETADDAI